MPSPIFHTGHDLVGRYRIIELLGIGHTAEVYLAEDLSLNRTVVVKVLLAHLAAHEDVRRAFRDHIVRSAALSHPHVARVFDGGQEAGSIFMVCEHLSGGSLEDVLSAGGRFAIDDVARLGRDIASALAYVHENGFVHGSLSPSKILIDDEGRVQLSDIALAGLSDPYRERLSLADVRYLSPEQVLGEPAGPKSDVYALALILFEAATGTAPFEGMTPEAVLRSRVNQPLPVRPELGTLDMLLAQAAVPDPRLRLDADQLANRLSAVVDSAPLVVAPLRREVPLLERFTPREPRTSIGFRPPSPDEIVGADFEATGVHQFPRPQAPRRPVSGPSRDQEFREARARRARGFEDLPINRPPGRRRLGFFIAAIVVVLAGVGGAAVWRLGLLTSKHLVPSLVDLNYKQAASLLKGDGFTLTVTAHVPSATVPVNGIVSQDPAKGTNAKSGLNILVTISSGQDMVTLPMKLIGENCATATAALAKLKITAECPSTAAIPSTRTITGDVAEVLYKNTKNPVAVPAHSTVVLALSKGPGPVVATTTTAPTSATTTTAATQNTTTTTGVTTTTTTVPGEGLRAVPNLVGLDQAQVYAAMHKASLYFTTHGPGAGTTKWKTVVSQLPAPGTMVAWHSTVSLNVK